MAFESKYIDGIFYKDVSPNMTSLTIPAPYKMYLGTDCENNTWNIFDGDVSTGNRNGIDCSPSKTWFTIDMGKKIRVDAYSLYWEGVAYTASSWNIQGSDDNINWEVLNTVPTTFKKTARTWYDWKFDKPAYYRYYKLQVLNTGGNSTSWNEMVLWQTAPQPINIYKSLEVDVPKQVEEQSIFLTDIGNIYVSRNDGSVLKMNGAEVKPFEEQNNLLIKEIEQINKILDTVNGKIVEVNNDG